MRDRVEGDTVAAKFYLTPATLKLARERAAKLDKFVSCYIEDLIKKEASENETD